MGYWVGYVEIDEMQKRNKHTEATKNKPPIAL